ncbi:MULTISPECIES: hypothetical protein [unclassified Mesorhizobium]|uniref:hypothetical protein n=1 Tax=unclassified Mesorhizobium TaxID=325217 RepID=UPI0030147EA9
MLEKLLSLFAGGNGYLIGGGAVFLLWLITILKAVLWGAGREREKQAGDKLAAAEERLEMDREATAAERQAAGMSDDEARKEAMRWAER